MQSSVPTGTRTREERWLLVRDACQSASATDFPGEPRRPAIVESQRATWGQSNQRGERPPLYHSIDRQSKARSPPQMQANGLFLSELPRDQLSTDVSMVKNKARLRGTCSMRGIIDHNTTSLRFLLAPAHLVLERPLLMRLPMLGEINVVSAPSTIKGSLRCLLCAQRSAPSTANVSSLLPLKECTALQNLVCCHTNISSLGPRAACTALLSLDCDNTNVSSLGPLAACAALQSISCSRTLVGILDPLKACTALQTLRCHFNAVYSLEPLAQYINLRSLDCSTTRVSSPNPILQRHPCQQPGCAGRVRHASHS